MALLDRGTRWLGYRLLALIVLQYLIKHLIVVDICREEYKSKLRPSENISRATFRHIHLIQNIQARSREEVSLNHASGIYHKRYHADR